MCKPWCAVLVLRFFGKVSITRLVYLRGGKEGREERYDEKGGEGNPSLKSR